MPHRLHPDRRRVHGRPRLTVIVTGAAGFVGRALTARLRRDGHQVVGVDVAGGADATGDIADPRFVADLLADGCDALVHLATVPGGAAEDDPAAAKRVNLDATMALAAAATGRCRRFVFASSIAVFGDPLPDAVDDATPPAPRLIYGAHKAMAEMWLATLARRGDLSSLALRLPGLVARPPGPSGMKSAFMSDVFHALAGRRPCVMPVSAAATMWLMSVECAAANLAHALTVMATGAVTLPALRVTMGDLAAEIARQAGADPALVTCDPDPTLQSGFGTQPALATPAADRLGFAHDGTLADLVTKGLNA